ncbi:MAG: alpha-2-macroglobulin, partial [Giesbergeria sp.]
MKIRIAAYGLVLLAASAQAFQTTRFSPQGEISSVSQVVAQFDGPAVQFGDPKAPAPFSITCSDATASQGSGRWTSEREWVFDFAQHLPPGVRCTAQPNKALKSPSGVDWKGAKSYEFNSGGPFVELVQPSSWQPLDEDQYFVLKLSGPATLASVKASAWCSMEGVGERIPVRLIEGAQRSQLLKEFRLDKKAAKEPLSIAILACNRRLTPGSKLQLVVGKGLATPSGVVTKEDKRFEYTVRDAFTAELSCERENA